MPVVIGSAEITQFPKRDPYRPGHRLLKGGDFGPELRRVSFSAKNISRPSLGTSASKLRTKLSCPRRHVRFGAALPSYRQQVQADIRTRLIHRPARHIIPPLGGAPSVLLARLLLMVLTPL